MLPSIPSLCLRQRSDCSRTLTTDLLFKVFDELAFGLKNLKRSKEEIQATVEMVAERLGLLDLLDHNPIP